MKEGKTEQKDVQSSVKTRIRAHRYYGGGRFSVYDIMKQSCGMVRSLAQRRIKTMERYLFDQNVTQYFEWLRNEHCKMTKHDALYRYLHKRAIMYAYADRFINVLGIEEEKAFEMLLMDKEEREEYLRVFSLKDI